MSETNKDQWVLEGDCMQCRRKLYCQDNCTARKQSINNIIGKAIITTIAKKLSRDKHGL